MLLLLPKATIENLVQEYPVDQSAHSTRKGLLQLSHPVCRCSANTYKVTFADTTYSCSIHPLLPNNISANTISLQ